MSRPIVDNPLSRKEEQQLVRAGRRLLLSGGFPNPERVGCPGEEILRAIAFRKADLREVEGWIDHLGCCSPCFVEYEALRHEAVWRRRLQVAGLCAVVLITIGLTAWFWTKKVGSHRPEHEKVVRRPESPAAPYQQAILDLRGRSVARGEAPPSNEPPLVLRRNRLALTVYLPFGSEQGKYDLHMSKKSGNPILATEGLARIRNGLTELQLRLDLTPLPSGNYSLEVRRHGESWNSYPVLVK